MSLRDEEYEAIQGQYGLRVILITFASAIFTMTISLLGMWLISRTGEVGVAPFTLAIGVFVFTYLQISAWEDQKEILDSVGDEHE